MNNSVDIIITIDVSSNNVKAGLVTDKLKLVSTANQTFLLIEDDIDGFAKSLDTDDLWSKIKVCIKDSLKKFNSENINIIGISSCAQRIGIVFLDKDGKVIYGGPNNDLRGIDSAYLIEDKFSEEELFNITAHSPSLLFGLARILWFQEEEEEIYEKIDKVITLDDWIGFRLTENIYSDYSSASDTQVFDIKKGEWSSKLITAFDIKPDFFPEVVESGTIIGNLRSELIDEFDLKQKEIPFIKSGGDTQATLIGMGVIKDGDIGISLGSTTPLHLVINDPIIDKNLNFWTTHHSIKGKFLIEANTGKTGRVYNWFKDSFLAHAADNADDIIENYLKNIEPGADSTFAFLGPQIMDFRNQTDIKQGVFVFQTPSAITEDLPTIENFARAVIENIAFGVYENHQALQDFTEHQNQTFCAGGMAKSNEFCKILANILDIEISVPQCRDSAHIGLAMNTLIGLKQYSDYEDIVNNLLKFEIYNPEPSLSKKYKNIYLEWKHLKKKVDDL